MDEEKLFDVEERLDILIKKYRRNQSLKDGMRLSAAIDAKKAIRRVIMIVAIQGAIRSIKPIFDATNGLGWEFVDRFGECRRAFSNSLLKVTSAPNESK